MIYTCFGCGREINTKYEDVYKQKHDEVYCRICNKKYPEFLKLRAPIYEAVDQLKKEKIANIRVKLFGTAKDVERIMNGEMPQPASTPIKPPELREKVSDIRMATEVVAEGSGEIADNEFSKKNKKMSEKDMEDYEKENLPSKKKRAEAV